MSIEEWCVLTMSRHARPGVSSTSPTPLVRLLEDAADVFGAAVGLPGPSSGAAAAGLPQHLLGVRARIRQNQPSFLQRVADHLVLTAGRQSRGLFPSLANMVLAEHLGLNIVEFPGGHIGYATHPMAFADQ